MVRLEADLWPVGRSANVVRALSLVPDALRDWRDWRDWRDLSSAQYLSFVDMQNFVKAENRAIDRKQMQLIAGSDADLSGCRQALQNAAGADVLIDAAGVAANFQRMVRIADAIGIPVDDMDSELGRGVREELGLARFATARNTFDAVPVD